MQLSQKHFFFAEDLKSTSNFEHLEAKDDPHRLCTSEIRHCEKRS